MSFHIRLCLPGDEQALALVGQATFLEAFAGVLSGTDILAHCASQHTPAIYRTWLDLATARAWIVEMEPAAAPVGYLVLAPAHLPIANPRKDDLEIKRIYVLHRFQGAGLGGRLMTEAVRHAKHAGGTRVLLGVYGQNHQAITFYEHLGFRQVGERRFQVGESTYDDIILGLDLCDDQRPGAV